MRTRLFAVLIVSLMCIPAIVSSGIEPNPEVVTILSQDIQQEESIPRVYGVDYSFDVFSSFSTENFRNYVIDLSEGIGSRHCLDASEAETGNNLEARNYIIDKMNELSNGRMEVQVVSTHFNVIGKLPGYLPGDNSAFIIAGHYDSWFASVGANEGAAGIASILELVDVLSDYEWPLDIYFVAENARWSQWGPFGSGEVAQWMRAQEIQPLVIYTLEALLFSDPEAPLDDSLEMVYLSTGPDNVHLGQYWAELSESMSKNYGLNRISSVSHAEVDYWGSRYMSHTYYYESGFMGTMIGIESGFTVDPSIRSLEDNYLNPTFRYYLGTEMTAAIGGSIAFTMSREYGRPIEYDIELEIEIGRTKSYYLPINTPTFINVSARWFGGNTAYSILDSENNIIARHEYNYTSPWTAIDIFTQAITQPGLYRLFIENTANHAIGYELQFSYDSDIDGNDVMDSQEYWIDTELFEQDDDGDSLSNAYEIILGTDPENSDSDSDGLPDSWELEYGLDPLNILDAMADADNDTLTNIQEYILGLDPLQVDTDLDYLPDAWEVEYGLNPLFDDSLEDPDEDEISNLQEYLEGTDPLHAKEEVMTIPVIWIATPSLVIVAGVAYYAFTKHRERTWTEY